MDRIVSTAELADTPRKRVSRDVISADNLNSPRCKPDASRASAFASVAVSGLEPSPRATARAPQKWNTATVWNAAVGVLKDTRNSIRLPGSGPRLKPPSKTTLPAGPPEVEAEAAAAPLASVESPQSVLSVLMPYEMDNAEDSCSLSGASCNRRVNARRSSSSTVSSCSGLSLDSAYSAPCSSRRSLHHDDRKEATSAGAGASGGPKRTPFAAASQSAQAVVKSAAASAAAMRKALSSPLEKAGIIPRNSANKEKQE